MVKFVIRNDYGSEPNWTWMINVDGVDIGEGFQVYTTKGSAHRGVARFIKYFKKGPIVIEDEKE